MLWLGCCGVSQAFTCTAYSGPEIDFGTVDVLSGVAADDAKPVNFGCNDVGPTAQQALICISAQPDPNTSGYDPRYLALNSNYQTGRLAYNLYQDAARSVILGSVDSGSYAPLSMVVTLTPYYYAGTATVYARTRTSGQAAPNGNYGIAQPFKLSYMPYVPGATCSSPQMVTTTWQPPYFNAKVSSQCLVSATTMNFGSVGSLSSSVAGTSTLNVTCNSASYTLELNNGQNYSGGTRRMKSASGGYVQYGLYQNAAHSVSWGSGTSAVTGAGTGLAQTLTVYGLVPSQTGVASGSYSDTIVVTLTY